MLLSITAIATKIISYSFLLIDDGNKLLDKGEVDLAIDCYNKALAIGGKEREGVILFMRGQALYGRAINARLRNKDLLNMTKQVLPKYDDLLQVMFALSNSPLAFK